MNVSQTHFVLVILHMCVQLREGLICDWIQQKSQGHAQALSFKSNYA